MKQLTLRNEYEDMIYSEYLIKVEDRKEEIVSFFEIVRLDKNTGEQVATKLQRKVQKFLCFGGPEDGKRATEAALRKKGYKPFNRAEAYMCRRKGKIVNLIPKCIFIHESTWGIV